MTMPATRKATFEPTPSRPKISRQTDIRPRRPITAVKNPASSKWAKTVLQLLLVAENVYGMASRPNTGAVLDEGGKSGEDHRVTLAR
jgi:hypothetical protein